MRGAFNSLGFVTPVPDSLLNVKPGHIRSVAEYHDHWRLRPLVTATALLAQLDPTHPFVGAARSAPGLLVMIDEIASAGGGAGHANQANVISKSPDEAERHVDKVYDIVSLLLGLTGTKLISSNENTGGSHG